MLNDDTNPVGAVHLGVVFTVEADGRSVAVREHEKLIGAFVEADAVADAWDRLETWSQLVAERARAPSAASRRQLSVGRGGPGRPASVPRERGYTRSMVRRALAALSLGLGVIGLAAPVAADSGEIARIELSGVIDQVNAAYIEEALQVAAADGDAAALIVIDSPGGELTSTDRILKAILASEVPVITWVAPEAARAGSAATFITLAGDVAAMAPNTNIGAASVVGGGGEDLPETLGEEVTNDAVARIRGLAEAHGRNADWAESAVRDAASIGADDAVAMEPPVVDLMAETTDELFAAIDEGERADGYAYQFNGEPLPPLLGGRDHRSG